MPWVRLDDQFTEHPKVVEAGALAAWLYVCGLTYCARQLTDGFIPTAQLRRLLPSGAVGKLADRLVDVRLWEKAVGGYRVHDYLMYNPSRQQTLATRQQKAAAGRKGGWQKASNVLADRQASATTPVPIPVPIATSTHSEHLPKQDTSVVDQHMATPASPRVGARPLKVSKQGYDADFEAWWSTYPRHDGKMPASLAYRDRLKAGREPHELAEAAQHFANHHEAAATPTEKIPHGSTWLHQHRDEEWEHGPPDADRVVAPRNGAGPPPKLAQTAAELRGLKLAREVNGDKRTSFFDLATAGVGLPDPGRAGADPRALPRPPDGPPLA